MLHQLNQWIQKREMEKFYVTIVEGKLTGRSSISGTLVRDESNNKTRVVAPSQVPDTSVKEMEAVTKYEALQVGTGYTLVEVELISGRTHQIRTHFQSIGHSLLGDIKYGGKAVAEVNYQLLHAWKIVMPDGRIFTAPVPELFSQMLRLKGITYSFQ
jgi:23S rRNA pseudouridine955/2504/2580 synthase